ncbi:MAG: tyrosine-type recombinase/integrase, partial [Terriglobales bacterium]
MTVAALTSEFLGRYLRGERNASPHTLRNYGVDLRQFVAFCGPELALTAIDAGRIRGFLGSLYARGCGKATAARHLATIRSLLGYATRAGYLEANPARTLRSPRRGRPLPAIPSTAEVNGLLDAPRDRSSFPERDRLMLELLYGSGLRVSELVGLETGDLDTAQGMLRVTGKGRKQRLVPFGRSAAAALAAYLPLRAALAPPP